MITALKQKYRRSGHELRVRHNPVGINKPACLGQAKGMDEPLGYATNILTDEVQSQSPC